MEQPSLSARWQLSRVHNAGRYVEPTEGGYRWSLSFFWETLACGVEQTPEGCEGALDRATARLLREVANEFEKSAFVPDGVQSRADLAYDGLNKEAGGAGPHNGNGERIP